jgi:ABC-type multidrug transport system fused ATPase/permease subunit
MIDFAEYTSILIIIFISILALILVARLILIFLIERSYQNYIKIKKAAKRVLPSNKKKYKKEEETLLRKIEIPRAHSALKAEKRMLSDRESGSYELMESNQQEEDLGQTEIVDFVKPIGFWTSIILGQKLTYLVQSAQVLNKRGNKGFWVSMIEAKDRVAGRQQGRGR